MAPHGARFLAPGPGSGHGHGHDHDLGLGPRHRARPDLGHRLGSGRGFGSGSGLRLAFALAVAIAVAAGACAELEVSPGEPVVASGVMQLQLPLGANRNLDLLFVIDNSPGIAPQRAKLLASYRRFMEELTSLSFGMPDLHIGVVTTDVGTRGPLDAGAGPSVGTGPGACTPEGDRGELRRAPSVDGNFLIDLGRPTGARERNYSGSLADAFVELADVGAAGCTYARPLEAMHRALANPANAGFRRERALLAVVFLTNDDDCSFGRASFTGGVLDRSRCTSDADSLVGVELYATALGAAVSDPGRLFVLGGFALPDAPGCADARPAPRLGAFFDRFPNRTHTRSICEPDLDGLLSTLPFFQSLLGPPCIPAPLDADPATDGLQPECVSWYRYRDRGALVDELVPACRGDAPGPCWQIRPIEPQWCTGPADHTVEFRDQRPFGLDAEARVFLECVTR